MTVENNHRWPAPNHNYVPEFQMSGIPFVESRTLTTPVREGANDKRTLITQNSADACKFSFDQVTRWINIVNHEQASKHIRVYFNEDAFKKAELFQVVGGSDVIIEDKHYYKIDGSNQTNRLELKCKNIWIYPEEASMKISVIAGLTNVPSNTFPDQTKLNGFTGVQS